MARRQQRADRALRPAMRSPGRPIPARHVERAFWRLIAQGRRTEEAAVEKRYADAAREAKERELARLQAELGVVCYAAPGKRGKLRIVA